jgi:hypothetical protein
MTTNPPVIQQPSLPPNTIVPENKDLFIPYMNRLYEDIAFAVNSKDPNYFTAPITDIAQNIPNLPNFGAFAIAISGASSGLPALTASLLKSSDSQIGTITPISVPGTAGIWAGATLTITSTATNFQVKHSVAGKTGNFNIRIVGTQ